MFVFGIVLNILLISVIFLIWKFWMVVGLVIVFVLVNDLFLCFFVYFIFVYGNIEGKMEYSEKWCMVLVVCL